MKKYNMSLIMKRASNYRKIHGWSKSHALLESWDFAKKEMRKEMDKKVSADALAAKKQAGAVPMSEELFWLHMKDRWTSEDYDTSSRLKAELRKLNVA